MSTAVGQTGKRLVAIAVAAVAAALLLGLRLGDYPLLDPDEAKHAEVAREMLASGRVLEPILNYEPYHHKPAFFYSLVGFGYRLFGAGELGARFVPAVAAWLTIVIATAYAARRGWVSAVLAAALLGTSPFFILTGRFTNFDALLTLCLTGAMLAIARLIEQPARKTYAYAFYVLVALAVLVKGPAALLLASAPVALAVWRGDLEVSDLRLASGCTLGGIIVGAWLVPTLVAAPKYLVDFLLVHNVQRYLAEAGADVFHPEPFWFFIPVLVVALLPWSPLLGIVLGPAVLGRGASRMLAEYCVWVVCFFSLSSGKLATYVLPAFPALAILTAERLAVDAAEEPMAGRHMASIGAGLCAALVVIAYAALRMRAPELQWLTWVLLPVSLAGAAVLLAGQRISTVWALATTCGGMGLTLVLLATVASNAISAHVSDKDLATAASSYARPHRVIAYRVRPFSFQFYTGWPLIYRVPVDQVRRAMYEPGTTLILTEERWVHHLEEVAVGAELRALRRNPRHVLYELVAPWTTALETTGLPSGSRLLR